MKNIIGILIINLILLALFLLTVPSAISFIPGSLFLGSIGYVIFALGEFLQNKRDRTRMVNPKRLKGLQTR